MITKRFYALRDVPRNTQGNKLKRIFNSLLPEEKDALCEVIQNAGIGLQFNTPVFRTYLKDQMFKFTGNSREFLKLFRRLDAGQQELFYGGMVSYD